MKNKPDIVLIILIITTVLCSIALCTVILYYFVFPRNVVSPVVNTGDPEYVSSETVLQDQDSVYVTPEAESSPNPMVDPFDVRGSYTPRMANLMCFRDKELSTICSVLTDKVVTCIGEENGAYNIVLSDGSDVWINGWYLKAKDDALESERTARSVAYWEKNSDYIPFVYENNEVYRVTADYLNCRAEPSADSTVLCSVAMSAELKIYGELNGFYLCGLPNGGIAWCSGDYVEKRAAYVHLDGAVDLREYLPKAQFDMKFTKADENITGRSLYPDVALLESTTAQKLYNAYIQFLSDGYILKICDAYRPRSAQQALWNEVGNSNYIANPKGFGSWHQYGRAVDITLVDAATGEELSMPTEMHAFESLAGRGRAAKWTEEQRANVDYMTRVMVSCGFGTLDTEWWHYQYTGAGGKLDSDLDLNALLMIY